MSPPGTGRMTLQPDVGQYIACLRVDAGKRQSLLRMMPLFDPMIYGGGFGLSLPPLSLGLTGPSLYKTVRR